MATQFGIICDINGKNSYALPVSDAKYSVTLLQNTGASFTIPAAYQNGVIIFSFQPGSNVWVAYNQTAAVPAGSSVASSTSEFNPTARTVKAGDVINMITPDPSANVGFVLYYI